MLERTPLNRPILLERTPFNNLLHLKELPLIDLLLIVYYLVIVRVEKYYFVKTYNLVSQGT